MRERSDQTADNVDAVATALQRTGGAITSAALPLRRLYARYGIREGDAEAGGGVRMPVVEGSVR